MLLFNFNDWTTWEAYNPSAGFIGPQKCTFDGPNKLILINYGETAINVKEDIYSGWKEWLQDGQHALFAPAIRSTGGDPIDDVRNLGGTFFLLNGWKIRSWEGDHTLNIDGNIYTEDNSPVFVSTLGSWTTAINSTVSNLIDQISSEITDAQGDSIAAKVWEFDMNGVSVTGDTVKNYISYLRNNPGMSLTEFLALKD